VLEWYDFGVYGYLATTDAAGLRKLWPPVS
jgi:hypothetical protein